MKEGTKRILLNFLFASAIIISALIFILLNGCKSIQYVEVPKVSHDTINIYNTRVDSIRFYDSISIKGKNDTIFVEKFRYRDRYHKIHDSIYLSRTDTLTKVEVKTIEKQLTKWQSFKLRLGGWSFGILLALIVGGAVYLFMKIKK